MGNAKVELNILLRRPILSKYHSCEGNHQQLAQLDPEIQATKVKLIFYSWMSHVRRWEGGLGVVTSHAPQPPTRLPTRPTHLPTLHPLGLYLPRAPHPLTSIEFPTIFFFIFGLRTEVEEELIKRIAIIFRCASLPFAMISNISSFVDLFVFLTPFYVGIKAEANAKSTRKAFHICWLWGVVFGDRWESSW